MTDTSTTASRCDVAVVGAGAVGTAIAWRCAQHGLSVTLVDPQPDRGAWRTAAGMLAPHTELHYAESPLLRLGTASLAAYPAFVAELEDASGLPTGYRECGTLAVAWDGADLAALRDLARFGSSLGLDMRMLTGREVRALEPALAPGVPGGMLAERDHQVDPRQLHAALLRAAVRAGVEVRVAAADLQRLGRDVHLDDGGTVSAGTVVLAAGAWSGHGVRPVKGQTLRLRLPGPPRIEHVVRGSVKGSTVYVVARASGEYVVGATAEEAGFDARPRAGAIYELLRDAQTLLPELGEAEFVEVSTAFRPGSPDNAPLLGPSDVDGVVLATGHYRNGILLTPVTATGIADYVATGELPAPLRPFTPGRLSERAS